MKSTGMVRPIDKLGRIVIPRELRNSFNLNEGDPLEIFTSNDKIVLRKYQPTDIFTGESENLIEYMGKKVSVDTIKILAEMAGLNVSSNAAKDEFEIEDDIDSL